MEEESQISVVIDEENKRIIAYFIDREESLGYFNIPVE